MTYLNSSLMTITIIICHKSGMMGHTARVTTVIIGFPG